MSSPERVSLSDAAQRLGVHYMTAYHYVRTGRLAAQREGAKWSVALSDLAALRRPVASPPRGVTSRDERVRRLRDRMTAGDEAGAWRVVEAAMTAGSAPSEIYLGLLAPALRSIGDGWENGEITVAAEHRASVVASRLVGRLGPRFRRRGRTRGAVVLGAAPGDAHVLPGAMLADLLRVGGFEPIDLGADVPARSFAEAAADADRLVAVVVGATLGGREDALCEVATAMHRALPESSLLFGGRAIDGDDHARALGAVGWSGHDAASAVARISALASAARATSSDATAAD